MLRNFSDKFSGNDDKGDFELHCLMMIIEDPARRQWAARLKITKKYVVSNARTTHDAQLFVLDELDEFPIFRVKVLEGFRQ